MEAKTGYFVNDRLPSWVTHCYKSIDQGETWIDDRTWKVSFNSDPPSAFYLMRVEKTRFLTSNSLNHDIFAVSNTDFSAVTSNLNTHVGPGYANSIVVYLSSTEDYTEARSATKGMVDYATGTASSVHDLYVLKQDTTLASTLLGSFKAFKQIQIGKTSSFSSLDYFWIELSFFGDYISPDSFNQELSLSSRVEHNNQVLYDVSTDISVQSPIIVSTNFVTGQQYKIKTVGTTDFILIGSIDNEIGTVFTATGPGLGNGTAYQSQIIVSTNFITGQQYEIKTVGTTNFILIGSKDSNIGTVFTATGPGLGNGTAYRVSASPLIEDTYNDNITHPSLSEQVRLDTNGIIRSPTIDKLWDYHRRIVGGTTIAPLKNEADYTSVVPYDWDLFTEVQSIVSNPAISTYKPATNTGIFVRASTPKSLRQLEVDILKTRVNATTVTNYLKDRKVDKGLVANDVGDFITTIGASTTGSTTKTATLTFSSRAIIPVGSSIVVSGVTPIGYNGTWTVTASSTTSVSYEVPATYTSQTIAGTINLSFGSLWQLSTNETDYVDGTYKWSDTSTNVTRDRVFLAADGTFQPVNSTTVFYLPSVDA